MRVPTPRSLTAIRAVLTEAAQEEDWERARELVAVHARIVGARRETGRDAELYVLVHPRAGVLGARLMLADAEADLAAVMRSAPGWASEVQIQQASFPCG